MNIGSITISLWITLTVVGAIASVINLRESILDLKWVQRNNLKNGRALIAKVAIFKEAARLTCHCLLFISGLLIANVQYNPTPPPVSIVVRMTIIFAIATLVAKTLAAYWLRRRLSKYYGGR